MKSCLRPTVQGPSCAGLEGGVIGAQGLLQIPCSYHEEKSTFVLGFRISPKDMQTKTASIETTGFIQETLWGVSLGSIENRRQRALWVPAHQQQFFLPVTPSRQVSSTNIYQVSTVNRILHQG